MHDSGGFEGRDGDDVLIVGGGPAGAMAALDLGRAGAKVSLIERDMEGRRIVCGSFVGPCGVSQLNELGFPWRRAGGRPLRYLKLLAGPHEATVALPFPAVSVPRPFLDTWLRSQAQAAGVQLLGHKVQGVSWKPERASFQVDLSEAAPRCAPVVFVATGKHEAPDGAMRAARDGGELVGFTVRLGGLSGPLNARVDETLQMFFFQGGYGGLAPDGKDGAIVSFLVDRSRLNADAREGGPRGSLLERLLHFVPEVRAQIGPLLEGGAHVAGAVSSIFPVPYGFVAPRPAASAAPLYRLGDQFATLPSLSGGGIEFALASGALAAAHHRRFGRAGHLSYARAARRLAAPVIARTLPLHRWLQNPAFASAGVRACAFWPGLLRMAAMRTRLAGTRAERLTPQTEGARLAI